MNRGTVVMASEAQWYVARAASQIQHHPHGKLWKTSCEQAHETTIGILEIRLGISLCLLLIIHQFRLKRALHSASSQLPLSMTLHIAGFPAHIIQIMQRLHQADALIASNWRIVCTGLFSA